MGFLLLIYSRLLSVDVFTNATLKKKSTLLSERAESCGTACYAKLAVQSKGLSLPTHWLCCYMCKEQLDWPRPWCCWYMGLVASEQPDLYQVPLRKDSRCCCLQKWLSLFPMEKLASRLAKKTKGVEKNEIDQINRQKMKGLISVSRFLSFESIKVG